MVILKALRERFDNALYAPQPLKSTFPLVSLTIMLIKESPCRYMNSTRQRAGSPLTQGTTTDMDEMIAKLLASVATLTEAVTRNSDNLDRVIAGQEAAMAKLDGATGGTTASKPRQRKADKDAVVTAATEPSAAQEQAAPVADPLHPLHPLLASPNGETAKVKNPKTGVDEDAPTANFRAADFSRDQVKAEFIGWLGETDNADVRKERSAFVAAIGQHFGVKQPFHPSEGLVDDEQRKQTLFFLRRKREGLAVDFSAEYDFDADPLADQTVEVETGGDDFDALG